MGNFVAVDEDDSWTNQMLFCYSLPCLVLKHMHNIQSLFRNLANRMEISSLIFILEVFVLCEFEQPVSRIVQHYSEVAN